MIKCLCGGETERRKAKFFTPQHLLIIQSFVYILRHPNLQPELVSLRLRANKRFHSLRIFRRNGEFSRHNFEDVFSAIISRLNPQHFLMAWQKINLDISGESNKRNKFVKCSEHYFSGREFIVCVQLSPSFPGSSFKTISASRLKHLIPEKSLHCILRKFLYTNSFIKHAHVFSFSLCDETIRKQTLISKTWRII